MSNQTKNSETLSWVCLGVGVVSWLFNPFALLSILGIFCTCTPVRRMASKTSS